MVRKNKDGKIGEKEMRSLGKGESKNKTMKMKITGRNYSEYNKKAYSYIKIC